MLFVSDLFRIRLVIIRIRNRDYPNPYLYPKLSVFEFESEKKYKNKYGISHIRPYPIRLHPRRESAGGKG